MQRLLLDALADAGHFEYLPVSVVAADVLGRSMTPSEYRSLIRAAWLLRHRGAAHLAKLPGLDYRGRGAERLAIWTCPMCSFAGASEHIPMIPCYACKEPTQQRNSRGYADCGRHRIEAPPKPCFHCGRSLGGIGSVIGYSGPNGIMVCHECASGRVDALSLANVVRADVGKPAETAVEPRSSSPEGDW